MGTTTLDIRPVGASLGAEIYDVDLNALDDGQRDALKQALTDHLVLFFPEQNLTPDGHRDFAAIFGKLEVIPALPHLDDDHPEIVVLDDTNTPAADVWHTDVTYSQHPPVGAVLHMITCPEVGGDTQWINLYEAYETLSAPLKEMLEGLTAIHANVYGEGYSEHPVVRVHPESSRKSLYVNRIFTSHIRQLSRPESDLLLPFLYRWSEQSRFSVRYRWKPGGVGIWDNRCTLHNVVNDWQGTRVINRVTILGDDPTGVGPPRWERHEPAANGASDFYGMTYPF